MDDGDWVDDYIQKSRFTRTSDRDCDVCGETEGSVEVDRRTDTARCRTCQNDPETFEEDDVTA